MTNLYGNKYKISNKIQHVDTLINFFTNKQLNPSVDEYLDKKMNMQKLIIGI